MDGGKGCGWEDGGAIEGVRGSCFPFDFRFVAFAKNGARYGVVGDGWVGGGVEVDGCGNRMRWKYVFRQLFACTYTRMLVRIKIHAHINTRMHRRTRTRTPSPNTHTHTLSQTR